MESLWVSGVCVPGAEDFSSLVRGRYVGCCVVVPFAVRGS